MKLLLDNKNRLLCLKLKKLKKRKKRLKIALDEITLSKAYQTWKKFNQYKYKLTHTPIKLLKLIFKITFVLFYFFIIIIFFSLSYIIFLISRPFAKKIKIPPKYLKLNGVSFIIPTWNKKKMVLNCLKNLTIALESNSTGVKTEVIVIDNGSIDKTSPSIKLFIKKTKIPINLVTLSNNLGFAKAINLGVKQSKYNYVYLLNNDMMVAKDFFSKLIIFAQKIIRSNKNFFGIASQIFFYDKTKRREESGKTYTNFNPQIINVAHCVNLQNLQKNSLTAYPGGGASLINKYLFLKMGGYDHQAYIPLYCEDLDLGWNAWKSGFPSYFCHQSQVIHHHRSSTKNLNRDPNFYLYKNLLVFGLKNYNQPKNFLSHSFFYSLSTLPNPNHRYYAIEALKNLPNIFLSKIKTYKHATSIPELKLINFIDFENSKNV